MGIIFCVVYFAIGYQAKSIPAGLAILAAVVAAITAATIALTSGDPILSDAGRAALLAPTTIAVNFLISLTVGLVFFGGGFGIARWKARRR